MSTFVPQMSVLFIADSCHQRRQTALPTLSQSVHRFHVFKQPLCRRPQQQKDEYAVSMYRMRQWICLQKRTNWTSLQGPWDRKTNLQLSNLWGSFCMVECQTDSYEESPSKIIKRKKKRDAYNYAKKNGGLD